MTTIPNRIKEMTCLDGSTVAVRKTPEGFVVTRRHDAAGCPEAVFVGPLQDATPPTNGTWSQALSLALDAAADLVRRVNTELRAAWPMLDNNGKLIVAARTGVANA